MSDLEVDVGRRLYHGRCLCLGASTGARVRPGSHDARVPVPHDNISSAAHAVEPEVLGEKH